MVPATFFSIRRPNPSYLLIDDGRAVGTIDLNELILLLRIPVVGGDGGRVGSALLILVIRFPLLSSV